MICFGISARIAGCLHAPKHRIATVAINASSGTPAEADAQGEAMKKQEKVTIRIIIELLEQITEKLREMIRE